jgi:hypothetical protein
LVLLLPRAERSAVRACAQAHRDGFPDEPVRVEEALDQLQSGAAQWEPSAWDALDGARRDEADAHHQLLALPAAEDAEKSADPERAVRAQDAWFPPALLHAQLGQAEQDAEAEPYRPDVVRSGEQSCAAQVFAARQQPAERLDVACSVPREQRRAVPTRPSMALQVQVELPRLRAAVRGEPVTQQLLEPLVVQAAQLERQASQPVAARPRVAQQQRVSAERKPELAARSEPRPGQAWAAEPRRLASAERPAGRGAAGQAQLQLPSSA